MLEPDALEETVGKREKDPGAISRVWIGGGGGAMAEVLEDRESLLDDAAALLSLDVGDEANAAGVVLSAGFVETPFTWSDHVRREYAAARQGGQGRFPLAHVGRDGDLSSPLESCKVA